MMFRDIFLIPSSCMKKTIMMPDYWVECLYGEGTGL
jgi:hypothetical protein